MVRNHSYDNETVSDRPLKKFLNYLRTTSSDKAALKENLHILLVPNSKLYLLTVPLIPGEDESEIEDLFAAETLGTEIKGKRFSSDDDFDPAQFYGKDALSKYVYANYDKVDFSGFKPLLDALNEIVQSS